MSIWNREVLDIMNKTTFDIIIAYYFLPNTYIKEDGWLWPVGVPIVQHYNGIYGLAPKVKVTL